MSANESLSAVSYSPYPSDPLIPPVLPDDRPLDDPLYINAVRRHLKAVNKQHRAKILADLEASIPEFRLANNIEPRNVRWLWPDRLPARAFTLLAGDPGVGKSLLAIQIAAALSSRRHITDSPIQKPNSKIQNSGSPSSSLDPSIPRSLDPYSPNPLIPKPPNPFPTTSVILINYDDSPDRTLIPRLRAAGADLKNITIVFGVRSSKYTERADRRLSLPRDFDHLDKIIRSVPAPRLVIFDTIHAAFSCGLQHSSDELQDAIGHLESRCRHGDTTILALAHLNKHSPKRLAHRIRGAFNFIAAARVAHMLVPHPTKRSRRMLITFKTAFGEEPPPLTIDIAPGPKLVFNSGEPNDAEALASLPTAFDLSQDNYSALEDAANFLRAALAAGPRPVKELIDDAHEDGITTMTLQRARRVLGITLTKPPEGGRWHWSIPEGPDNKYQITSAKS